MATELTIRGASPDTISTLATLPRATNTPLLPALELRQTIGALTAVLEPIGDGNDAVKATALLVGSYPKHAVDDPEIYTRAMKSLMARYSLPVCFAAIDALTLRSKWIPTRADLREELERQVAPVRAAKASAEWMLAEHDRRRQEAENDRAIEASKAAFREKHGGKSPLEVLGPKFSAEEPTTTKGTDE